MGILRAIANDARTQKEIAAFTGLVQGHISQYLSILQEAGFVERRAPVTQAERSRLGRYHIVDPYLRFYYRFLANRQTQLALGVQEQSLAEIKRHLRDFIGANTWEDLPGMALTRQCESHIAFCGRSGRQRLDAWSTGGCGGHQLDGEAVGAWRVQMGS
ncbi:MAG: helix-turn-helix transcriptional regulator [Anaerolineae bacterium]|nr:helix-turn-helix transcriptional regulator [Anaerolineae bacterium]